jgi:hypothetical protein
VLDILRAQILILHAKVERERLQTRIAFLERTQPMTPKVQGIASALAKLHHNLDDRADKLLARIETVDRRGDTAFKGAHARLDESEAALGEVDALLADLEKTNGGPISDGSSGSSIELKDSWKGREPLEKLVADHAHALDNGDAERHRVLGHVLAEHDELATISGLLSAEPSGKSA